MELKKRSNKNIKYFKKYIQKQAKMVYLND